MNFNNSEKLVNNLRANTHFEFNIDFKLDHVGCWLHKYIYNFFFKNYLWITQSWEEVSVGHIVLNSALIS